jgi:hypothetical protein
MKGRKQVFVCPADRPARLVSKDQSEWNHITLIAAITFSMGFLKRMHLTQKDVGFTCSALHQSRQGFELCATGSAYQMERSMASYITNTLDPLFEDVRSDLHNSDAPNFLITDNRASDGTALLMDMYEELNIAVIWLPRHSSNFLQPFHLTIFTNLKRRKRTG